MSSNNIQDIIKLSADEIFDFIVKNPDLTDNIINTLKIKDRTKFFKVSADLKSYKLNERGSAALKKDVLENITKDKAISVIKIEKIKLNPKQPRKVFRENKLIELSESIKTHGLLQPIVVSSNDDDTYTLVAGERRLKAHQLAKIDEIKAIILDVDAIELRKLAIIENLHRDDLSPLEEGLSYLELQNEGNYSLRDLEDIVKKNKNYIAARLNLTKFDQNCLDIILKEDITNISKMLKILSLEPKFHKMLLIKLAKNELSNEEIDKLDKKITVISTDDSDKNMQQSNSTNDNFNNDEEIEVNETINQTVDEKEKDESKNKDYKTPINSQEYKIESIDNIEDNVIQETPAIKISGIKSKKVNITIDVENMTGKDYEILKNFITSLWYVGVPALAGFILFASFQALAGITSGVANLANTYSNNQLLNQQRAEISSLDYINEQKKLNNPMYTGNIGNMQAYVMQEAELSRASKAAGAFLASGATLDNFGKLANAKMFSSAEGTMKDLTRQEQLTFLQTYKIL